MGVMAFSTFMALLILVVVCNSAAVRNIKGDDEELKLMKEIKKCFKAAKSLQTDPGNNKKTTVFLKKCEKFLKDVKLTEEQKKSLEKIGYKMEDLISEKGFGYEPSTEEEHDGEVRVTDTDETEEKTVTDIDVTKEKTGTDTDVTEEKTVTDTDETEEKTTADNAEEAPPEQEAIKQDIPEEENQTEEHKLDAKDAESPERHHEPEVTTQATENISPNGDSTAQAGINFPTPAEIENILASMIANEQQARVNPTGENINQYGGVNQNFPPINLINPPQGQENFPINLQGVENNQIFHQQHVQFQHQFPGQGHPAIANQQPFMPNADFQQPGFPVPGMHPDILLNQQTAQHFQNPQFFNQPLEGGAAQFNQPPQPQGPAFFGNQQLPPQPQFGFNPQMAGNIFDPNAAQANNFVPPINNFQQAQQQHNVQNFQQMNDPQNPNVQNFQQMNDPQNPNVQNFQQMNDPQNPNVQNFQQMNDPQNPNVQNFQQMNDPQNPNVQNFQQMNDPQNPNILQQQQQQDFHYGNDYNRRVEL